MTLDGNRLKGWNLTGSEFRGYLVFVLVFFFSISNPGWGANPGKSDGTFLLFKRYEDLLRKISPDQAWKEVAGTRQTADRLPPKVGVSEKFYVDCRRAGASAQIAATLVWQGRNVNVYFQDGAGNFPDGFFEGLGKDFDQKHLPRLAEFFGPGPNPGIDGDPRVAILFIRSRFINENFNGFAGFFNPIDVYPREVVEKKYPGCKTNERDVIYVNLDAMGGFNPSVIQGVVVHEYQHLVNFFRSPSQELWLNEGFSQVAESLLGFPIEGMKLVAAQENPGLPLNDWSVWGTIRDPLIPYALYGHSFLWVSFIADRFKAGQEPFFSELSKGDRTGIAGLEAFFKTRKTGMEVEFPAYAAALYLSGDSEKPPFIPEKTRLRLNPSKVPMNGQGVVPLFRMMRPWSHHAFILGLESGKPGFISIGAEPGLGGNSPGAGLTLDSRLFFRAKGAGPWQAGGSGQIEAGSPVRSLEIPTGASELLLVLSALTDPKVPETKVKDLPGIAVGIVACQRAGTETSSGFTAGRIGKLVSLLDPFSGSSQHREELTPKVVSALEALGKEDSGNGTFAVFESYAWLGAAWNEEKTLFQPFTRKLLEILRWEAGHDHPAAGNYVPRLESLLPR